MTIRISVVAGRWNTLSPVPKMGKRLVAISRRPLNETKNLATGRP
jgi:hypothetical protein